MKTRLISKLFIFIFIFSVQQLAHASSSGGKTSASKYFSISPAIVVNVTDEERVRHLQVSVQLRLDDPADSGLLEDNMPVIQHTLVMSLSGREAKNIRSTQGKQNLRTEVTALLKKVLEEITGKPIVNAVYFTAFVIQ